LLRGFADVKSRLRPPRSLQVPQADGFETEDRVVFLPVPKMKSAAPDRHARKGKRFGPPLPPRPRFRTVITDEVLKMAQHVPGSGFYEGGRIARLVQDLFHADS
jgi:hypothetical protein